MLMRGDEPSAAEDRLQMLTGASRGRGGDDGRGGPELLAGPLEDVLERSMTLSTDFLNLRLFPRTSWLQDGAHQVRDDLHWFGRRRLTVVDAVGNLHPGHTLYRIDLGEPPLLGVVL